MRCEECPSISRLRLALMCPAIPLDAAKHKMPMRLRRAPCFEGQAKEHKEAEHPEETGDGQNYSNQDRTTRQRQQHKLMDWPSPRLLDLAAQSERRANVRADYTRENRLCELQRDESVSAVWSLSRAVEN